MADKNIKKSLVYLKRSQLEPHPDNPRKDLSDLEELRASIRENGIMQNLTVIPTDDNFEHFRILIGHRRFAASEGIEDELPCRIVEGLSDKEQLSVMLCENMQRSDLTFIEQAHGFQLMLDLGDTVEEIAQKTGFSSTTVKHRLKINELDQNSISEASEYFQLTIGDFIELEKVKDIEKRNEILADARNSSELAETVQDYLEELERNKKEAEIKEVMAEIGWKKTDKYFSLYSSEWSSVAKWTDSIDIDQFDEGVAMRLRKLAEKEQGEIFYRISWRYLEIARKEAKKKDEKKKKTKEELRREEMDKKSKLLESARRDICDEYLDFLRDAEHPDLPKLKADEILALAERLFRILESLGGSMSPFLYLAKTQYKTQRELEDLSEVYKSAGFIRRLLLQVWENLASSYQNKFVNYYHKKNDDVLNAHREVYDILHSFGLNLEKDLKDVINGTSELYLIDGKEQWISKEDTGTESNTEAQKGLASDSFKRACFNWGIGRELYTAPFIWISSEDCNITPRNDGKFACYDRFTVRGITIQDKRITGLSIYNEKTKKLAYKFGEVVDYREELKKYIEEHGLNQQEIVKACGLGRNSTARQYKAALAYAKEQAR